MSKYSIAETMIEKTSNAAGKASIDRNDAIEALMTLCIQHMKDTRGSAYTRDYLSYELDSCSAGGVYEIQKR